MDIISYVMNQILDPTNIIEGDRYEFTLELNIDEEDELFQVGGVDLRAIIAKKEQEFSVVDYFFIAKADQTYLEFALEDDEEQEVLTFCKAHIEAGE